MANNIAEIRRSGIDVTNNGVWFFDIYGDPSRAPGFVIANPNPTPTPNPTYGIGSIARRWDGQFPGAMYTKFGPQATDWTPIFFGLSRAISLTDLPDMSGFINAQLLDAVTNPLTTPPGLTSPEDFAFALKTFANT